jgi:hypothetical protein
MVLKWFDKGGDLNNIVYVDKISATMESLKKHFWKELKLP